MYKVAGEGGILLQGLRTAFPLLGQSDAIRNTTLPAGRRK
jgi:hypothetical protein